MADERPADIGGAPDKPVRRKLKPWRTWRVWLRVLHRDAGYLAIGLTFIYALSGIAINHIEDWNPNFVEYEKTYELGPLPDKPEHALAVVQKELGLSGEPRDVYEAAPGQLEIEYDAVTLHVDTASGQVFAEGSEPRFFFRVANWLHYNRGKAAWTYIADGYALFLIFLALSGAFMLKGRKGLVGRGGILIAVGIAIPVVYVTWSGGP